MKTLFVYIATNRSRTLYTGVTGDLPRRMRQHKSREVPGFTKKYNITMLVYYESVPDPIAAIDRESEIKKWTRRKKIRLIESANPEWIDLSEDWPDR